MPCLPVASPQGGAPLVARYGGTKHGSFATENEVHRPAAADVESGSAEVIKDGGVRATRLFEGIYQDSESLRLQFPGRQDALLVSRLGQRRDRRSQPGGIE